MRGSRLPRLGSTSPNQAVQEAPRVFGREPPLHPLKLPHARLQGQGALGGRERGLQQVTRTLRYCKPVGCDDRVSRNQFNALRGREHNP